ncbi:FAD-dependent hydroxylase [Picosynechococcus sp. NKBG15041c]|uniref:FAD-dependent hydroxylase n=1 Tax=Picosynechococcus sp. NKBG15041c TaxID=1407650 RepID=UPI000400F7B5|nr:FAD-dependent hydroxylase [Picosynechococcus sp. NKBG15041c]
MMTPLDYDIIIVGGGIPGLTLACGLRGCGLRIAVLEAQSAIQVGDRPRAYALSPLSAKIFQAMGLWKQLAPAMTHFPKVVLADGHCSHQVVFRPVDLGEPAVYHCAEHRILQQALQGQIATDPQITCHYQAWVQTVVYGEMAATVTVATEQGQQSLTTALVVAADGRRSPLRQGAGIKTDGWDYWQSCITAVVTPMQDHQNIAYERFWPGGPFAILPLPHNCCQVVWVLPHAEAEAIAALPPEQFLGAMAQCYGDHSGSLRLLSQPLVFPARLMHSRRYYRPRLVLLGDAAHHCHPVGGQGLNLGIRDAATLAQLLLKAREQNQDLGHVRVLRRYGRRRHLENWFILLFTDVLNRVFSNNWWPMVIGRRWVLWLMKYWSPLRRVMLHLMTGLWGDRLFKFVVPEKIDPTEPKVLEVHEPNTPIDPAKTSRKIGQINN